MNANFMIVIVFVAMTTIIGLMGVEYYTGHEAVAAGLQQCVTNVDGKNQVIWTKECK